MDDIHSDDFDTTPVRLYRKDHRKLKRMVLEASEERNRTVTLAEMISDAVRLLETENQRRKERELAR